MKRTLVVVSTVLLLSACQVAPERAAPLPPLPDTVTPQSYSRLLERARAQAGQANDAFYLNDWDRVKVAAEGLMQTAKYMRLAYEVPDRHKDTLVSLTGDLGKLAKELFDGAEARDAKKTTSVMAQVHAKIRDMRVGDPAAPAPAPPPSGSKG